MKSLFLLLISLTVFGCGSLSRALGTSPPSNPVGDITAATTETVSNLSMLSGIGGLSILGGIVLLVVTAGRKGWYPIFGGVGLVFLNAIMQEYFHFIALPIIVASGVISAGWAYRSLHQARFARLKKKMEDRS